MSLIETRNVLFSQQHGSLSHPTDLRNYFNFDNPPTAADKIDTLIVLGTSKTTDTQSFSLRVATALEYATRYPESNVIFSGKNAHGLKARPEETGGDYIESAVMASEAITQGLNAERVKLETEATNTRENIIFSLPMLSSDNSALFVCSGYLGRRVDLYLQKLGSDGNVSERRFFIVDGDVQKDAEIRDEEMTERERVRRDWKIHYEWSRIVAYREKGDL